MSIADFVVKNFWNLMNGITILSVLNFPINIVQLVLLLSIRFNLDYLKDISLLGFLLGIWVVLFIVWAFGALYKRFIWNKMNSHVNRNNPELMDIWNDVKLIKERLNVIETQELCDIIEWVG